MWEPKGNPVSEEAEYPDAGACPASRAAVSLDTPHLPLLVERCQRDRATLPEGSNGSCW